MLGMDEFRTAHEFRIQLVSRPARLDETNQVAPNKRQVADAVENLVSGAFIRSPQRIVDDSRGSED